MSSTARGAKRSEADFYPTPPEAVYALLNGLPNVHLWNMDWCEPCAGNGDIIAAVNDWWRSPKVSMPGPWWTAVELREECKGSLEVQDRMTAIYCPQDFLSYNKRHHTIITNPPFSLAQEMIEHSQKIAFRTIMLLRLNFLGSQKRREWHWRNPSDVYVLSKRPSFTGMGTDSIEYAWFVFPGKQRFFIL